MQRVTKPIVLGVAALFGLGLITAAAADTQADAVRAAVMKAKSVAGQARGELVSAVANADAMADKTIREAEQDLDQAAKGNRDAHGDAVSAVANSDQTLAHTTGIKKVNHGGAVSAVAR